MSIFSLLGKKDSSDLKQQMSDYLSNYMGTYASLHPNDMDSVAAIFAEAIQMIATLSPRDVKKSMNTNNVSAELGALNILQNCAMANIKSCDTVSFLIGGNDSEGAYNLYMAINDEKYERKLISKKQYEDNKLLGTKLQIGLMPF